MMEKNLASSWRIFAYLVAPSSSIYILDSYSHLILCAFVRHQYTPYTENCNELLTQHQFWWTRTMKSECLPLGKRQ